MSTYKELLKQNTAAVDEEKKKKTEDATQKKEQIGTALDAAADAAASPYRQEIENAPLDSRAAYDQNAMREAIDRKQIRESMANMGMTDSGLSSSMQTALAVQKSRADNQVRVEERQRIQAAQSAIDKIYSDMELEKTSQNMAIDQEVADWESNARLSAQTNAQTNAATYYEANTKAETEATKMALEQQKNRSDMAQKLLLEGKKVQEAWAAAYKAYPDYTTVEGVQYAQYGALRERGYSAEYAKVASQAYATAIGASGTAEQAAEAMSEAVKGKAESVARKYGITTWQAASTADAEGVTTTLAANTSKVAGINATNTEIMEITAYMTGMAYRDVVMKTTDTTTYQKIGEALEANLSGVYLEIALACAGLQ